MGSAPDTSTVANSESATAPSMSFLLCSAMIAPSGVGRFRLRAMLTEFRLSNGLVDARGHLPHNPAVGSGRDDVAGDKHGHQWPLDELDSA